MPEINFYTRKKKDLEHVYLLSSKENHKKTLTLWNKIRQPKDRLFPDECKDNKEIGWIKEIVKKPKTQWQNENPYWRQWNRSETIKK